MLIVYGSIGIIGAALLFGVTLIGARNPRTPAWADDFLVANIYVPMMIGLAVLGVGALGKAIAAFGSRPPSVKELLLAAGIVVIGLLLLKSLRIRQHLAGFASRQASDQRATVQRFPVDAIGPGHAEVPTDRTPGNLAA